MRTLFSKFKKQTSDCFKESFQFWRHSSFISKSYTECAHLQENSLLQAKFQNVISNGLVMGATTEK